MCVKKVYDLETLSRGGKRRRKRVVLMVRYENLLTKNLEDMEEQVNGQANEANNYKSHILAYRNKKVTAGDLENWLDKIEKKRDT